MGGIPKQTKNYKGVNQKKKYRGKTGNDLYYRG